MRIRHCIDSIFAPKATATPFLLRLTDRVLEWIERSRQRAILGRLDERLLKDIGCDRAQASVEADKPFWRE